MNTKLLNNRSRRNPAAIAIPLEAMLFSLPPMELRSVEIMASMWRKAQRFVSALQGRADTPRIR